MLSVGISSQERWRRTGTINIVLVTICAALLLGSLIASIKHGSSSIDVSTIIIENDCNYTSKVNLLLHLVINLISTCILASSNFYMQVLSSPSRKEIDRAHEYLRSLDIGIPSVKNIRFVSRFKQICWVILLLSSLPLHLVFNSAIFETSFQGANWNVTIATEAFTQGADFFAPGASLSPAGLPTPAYVGTNRSDGSGLGYGPSMYLVGEGQYDRTGYGEQINLTEYWNESSLPRLELSATARNASTWARLDPQACLAEYRSCNSRMEYFDVVIIVDSPNAGGWTRSEVFHFNPNSNLSSIWDPHIPPNDTNSLWYSTRCMTTRSPDLWKYNVCENTCLKVLGLDLHSNVLGISYKPPTDENWTLAFQPSGISLTAKQTSDFGYDKKFSNLEVNYCLSRVASRTCKIGVANSLLLVVLSCVLIKIVTCIVIIWKLPYTSLVTPGDAMESFISKPDPRTEGLGTLGIADSERLEYGTRKPWVPGNDLELTPIIRPRRWQNRSRRFIQIIPRVVWTRTYGLLLLALAFVSACLVLVTTGKHASPLSYSFGHSDDTLSVQIVVSYISALIIANGPQLFLSFCYFSYNTFFTRIAVEQEWYLFSVRYQPLRVSYPVGEQTSNYRLQLPYKYSVPLLVTSILLHWLVSNTIYIFINEGGYWEDLEQIAGKEFGVSADAFVAIGYSPPAILVVFIVSVSLTIIPVVWGFRKVKGNMVSGGTNSLVISAACHATVLPGPLRQRGPSKSKSHKRWAYERVDNPLMVDEDEDRETEALRELARSKLRWGVLPLPPELASQILIESGQVIKHLGFGGVDNNVETPKDGHLYV